MQNSFNTFLRRFGWTAAFCLSVVAQAPAQDAERAIEVNSQRQQVDVREGTVIYTMGNDLVVKMQDGSVKHFAVPADQNFDIDGK